MDFPIIPSGGSRPHGHHHHHHQSSHNRQVIPFQFGNSSSCRDFATASYNNTTKNIVNNQQHLNSFNFPLRSSSNNKAPASSSPNKRVTRFSAITEEDLNGSVATNSQVMNKPVQRNHVVSDGNNGNHSQEVQPQYRIFKRGETIPGFTSPLSLIPQGAVATESTATKSLEQEGVISAGADENRSEESNRASSSVESTDGKGKRGPGNRTPISLVSDIARFHNVRAEYRLTNETGPPHAPTFTVVLTLGEEQYQAQGASIKKAQLAAAGMALEQTALKPPPPRNQPKKQFQATKNPKRTNWTIMRLNTLAEELGEKISFTSQPVQILNPFNRMEPPSVVAVNFGDRVFTAEGPNLNTAKNNAALAALKSLTQLKKERELTKALESEGSVLTEAEDLDSELKSPISIVHEMALKRGLKVSFEIVGEEGPPHMKVFTIKCKVGALESEGQGPTKQQAKKASSENMIAKLKEIPMKQSNLALLKSLQNGSKAKPKPARKKPTTPVIKEVKTLVVSPISRLLQIAHVRKYKEPEFRVVVQNDGTEAINPSDKIQDRRNKRKKPFFTIEVIVGPYVCQGSGSNKKTAKKAAADAALVLMGYAPTEPQQENAENETNEEEPSDSTCDSIKKQPPVKVTGARQIVPGVLVLQSETNNDQNSSATSTFAAQEIAKVNSMSAAQTAPAKVLDGIGKLSYLAELLGITVSYSDFPKKNEFLSVASLGTNPPHVAHGIGPTREEAQNSAACQLLEELSTTGLDNLTSNTQKAS